MNYRVGIGFDLHKLEKNRKLILGGVEIPYELGLLGHSDADVLVHAIIDAILGSIACGDIGKHFPVEDPAYKDIDSLLLLNNVKDILSKNSYSVTNIDSVIIAEKPKLATFTNKMCENISKVLNINVNQVSVKAKTMEGCGAIGEGKAIAAKAIILVEKI